MEYHRRILRSSPFLSYAEQQKLERVERAAADGRTDLECVLLRVSHLARSAAERERRRGLALWVVRSFGRRGRYFRVILMNDSEPHR